MSVWLTVLGIGDDGLAGLLPAARALLDRAEVVAGGVRHLALVQDAAPAAERLAWRSTLAASVTELEALRGRRVVVLATGDPMHFGIGVKLVREFGRDAVLIVPAPGAFSLAAARMGWPLQRTRCISVHGRPLDALRLALAPGARILALSEDGTTPVRAAALLCDMGYGPSELTVLEHLGGPRERIVSGTAAGWGEARSADLNTLAIVGEAEPGARLLPTVPGLPDEAFRHDGQITKRAVRAATLALLAPMPGETLWDVGAGSGAIAIEWLRAAENAQACAIETSAARCANIAVNAARLGVPRLEIVAGAAPGALGGLPVPDAIFIGGGVSTPGLIDACWQAIESGGRLVANAVTVAGEAAVLAAQARLGGNLARISIAQAEPVGGYLAWRPQLPVTQWRALRGAPNADS